MTPRFEEPTSDRRTRRELFEDAGRTGAAGALALTLPGALLRPGRRAVTPGTGFLSVDQRQTLRAAVARIIPAEGAGDWSAADVGADAYIDGLLSAGVEHVFAGGPDRSDFANWQKPSRVKQIGWTREVKRLRELYRAGLAQLDSRAGGDFADAPVAVQDSILYYLDGEGSDFFAALYDHTMEGVYSHPVYGGNTNYHAWKSFGYAGDVHGVRFPNIGPADAPWNVFGGYAPSEMVVPGSGSA